jgi:hypothetical protein
MKMRAQEDSWVKIFGLLLVPFCLPGQLDSFGAVDLGRRLERPSETTSRKVPVRDNFDRYTI